MKKNLAILLCLLVFFFISCNNNDKTSALGLGTEISEEPKILPAVNLTDKAFIWVESEGNLDDKPLEEKLDMGTQFDFLGEEKTFGKYNYIKIKTKLGSEGWISEYYSAKNAIPAVVAETTILHTFPDLTALSERRVPAGQIVAVYIDPGVINGYAKIAYSTYKNDGSKTGRYVGYINKKLLSTSKKDMDCALLMTRANQDNTQWATCVTLAFKIDSIFKTYLINEDVSDSDYMLFDYTGSGNPITDKAKYTNDMANLVSATKIEALSIPLLNGEEATRWVPVMADNEPFIAHINSYSNPKGLRIDDCISSKITNHPNVTNYDYNPTLPGYNVAILQGLPFYDRDANNNAKVVWKGSLDIGEDVYIVYEEEDGENDCEFKAANGVTYLHIRRADGTEGWANKKFIYRNSLPSYIVSQEEVNIFSEQNYTAFIKNVTVKPNQFVATSVDSSSDDWEQISFYDSEKDKIYDVFVPKNTSFSITSSNEYGQLSEEGQKTLNSIRLAEKMKYIQKNEKDEKKRDSLLFVYAYELYKNGDLDFVSFPTTRYIEKDDEEKAMQNFLNPSLTEEGNPVFEETTKTTTNNSSEEFSSAFDW